MLTCQIFGHKPELLLNLDTKEIELKCMNCGEDQTDLLNLLEGKSKLSIPSQYTIYRDEYSKS